MGTATEAGAGQPANAQPGAAPTGAGQPATPAVADSSGQQDQKAAIDKAYAAAADKVRKAEVEPLKAQLAELSAKLTGTKSAEEQAKEFRERADAEGKRAAKAEADLALWETRATADADSRAAKLPAPLVAAFEKAKDLPLQSRLDLLASLEAAVPAAGAISPPGGKVGSDLAGIDVAAIAQQMAAGNPTLYREALKGGVKQMQLDKAIAEHGAVRR